MNAERRWLQVVFLISGAPGLAAQLTWTRVFTGGLGHELSSLLGVVSAFFAGLAGGAWVWSRWLRGRRYPARVYAGLEGFSAVWIALTTPCLGMINETVLRVAGPESPESLRAVLAFLVPLAVVGPAAGAMGGTLPAMERAVAPMLGDRAAVAGLYGLNALGGVLGTLGAVFVSMPNWGFRATLLGAALAQAVLAILVTLRARGYAPLAAPQAQPSPRTTGAIARRLMIAAFATGLLGLGFEWVGVRTLAQLTENTVHTYAWSLSVFLLGMAMGSAWLRLWQRRGAEPSLGVLLLFLGTSVLMELAVLAVIGAQAGWLRSRLGLMGSELALAVLVFLLPALAMGAVFASLTQSACRQGMGAGGVMAWNAVGSALAGPVVLMAVLPWLGLKWAFAVVAIGYAVLSGTQGWGWRHGWLVVAAVVLPMALPPRLALLDVPPGAVVQRFEEGRLATVSVVRTPDGHRTLRVNNRFQQGGTATAIAAQRHAVLPMLLCADRGQARRTLFLGVGTGITLGAATAFAGTSVDGVELLPEVLEVLREFAPENRIPSPPASNPRWVAADARRFVRSSRQAYDLIVADLFHPSEDGAGFLYTRDHFDAIRRRLAPGGWFCQWLPLHQLDYESFRTVARTFLEVFPESTLWLLRSNADLPVVGLVGSERGFRADWERVGKWMAEPEAGAVLKAVALGDPLRVYGSLLADSAGLKALAGPGPVATDDRPLVLFGAARAVYAGGVQPQRNLRRLLDEADPGFREGAAAGWGEHLPRLQAYRESRDRHLRGLILETEGRRREALEAYLASAAASADYTAGYGQAVLIASAYREEDPAFARDLLERLIRVRPEQRLAREVLARFGP